MREFDQKNGGERIFIKKQQHDPIFLAQIIPMSPLQHLIEHPVVGNKATVIKSITYALHRNMASYDYGEKGTAYTIQDQARSYLFS
jgi:hypothetical protein